MKGDAWNSHKWSSANGRRIEIGTGKPVIPTIGVLAVGGILSKNSRPANDSRSTFQCSACGSFRVTSVNSGSMSSVQASRYPSTSRCAAN